MQRCEPSIKKSGWNNSSRSFYLISVTPADLIPGRIEQEIFWFSKFFLVWSWRFEMCFYFFYIMGHIFMRSTENWQKSDPSTPASTCVRNRETHLPACIVAIGYPNQNIPPTSLQPNCIFVSIAFWRSLLRKSDCFQAV